MRSDPTLQRIYRKYNKQWFEGKLPRLPVVWGEPRKFPNSEGKSTLASTHYEADAPVLIVFAPRLRVNKEWNLVRCTMLHEMCHVALPYRVDHGKIFQNLMRDLAMRGAFDGLW